MPKSRVFNVMQYEVHPETGVPLLSEEKIKDALAHRTIKRWAYICHDADVYTALDEEHNPEHIKGAKKPRHWHIVIEMGSNQVEVGVIARWLGITDNFVNVAKGRGAFLDCVKYLTHEDDKQKNLGKRLYDDGDVSANFDFRAELDSRAERVAMYGRDLNDKDMLRNQVLFKGKSLKWVMQNYPIEYQNDFSYLERCRLRYLSGVAESPKVRINFYVDGQGGIGKSLISKAIARKLVDPDGVLEDDEIFFVVGAENTTFEGYDGQPCLIWDDCRAYTLLKKLGGRENVFEVFSLFPDKVQQNIKYGSVRLNNSINIVNSVEPWGEFLDALAGEYKEKDGTVRKSEKTQKSQSYRRFPFFVCVHEKDYDLGMNKGVFLGTREFEQYFIYKGIQANFQKIAEKCGDNLQLVSVVNGKALEPVSEKYLELKEKLSRQQDGTDEEIIAYFDSLGYGKPKEVTELEGQVTMETDPSLPF